LKSTKLIAVLFVIFLACLALSRQSSSGAEKLRIVSICPGTTEILYALGLGEEIVGVSSFCNYPEDVFKKEKVGSFSRPSLEKIVALRPDVIFATGLEQNESVNMLREYGCKVVLSDPKNMDELFESISQIGRLTYTDTEAQSLIDKMRLELTTIQDKVKKTPYALKPRVFVEIWSDPLMSAGKDSFVDELIAQAGGVNIARDAPRPYSIFSPELVIYRDPDYIILGYMQSKNTPNDIRQRVGWSKITAVMTDNVISDINPDILLRPSPRAIDAVRQIYQRIYCDKK